MSWAETAIKEELTHLAQLPAESPQRPGSEFSTRLLKIASVAKGAGKGIYSQEQLIPDIVTAVNGQHGLTEKEITRQWTRAWNKATPRHPNGDGIQSRSRVGGQAIGKSERSPQAAAGIDVRSPKTADFRKAFELLGYSFSMNQLDDSVWCSGSRLTDGTEAVIRNRCRDMGLTSPGRIKDAMVQFAFERQFHPVRDYLSTLTWDGKDWIALLVSQFLEETTGLGETAFRRWMVGSVAKIYERGQNFMMVWDGPQGIGKSTLARWLCPLPAYFIEGPLRPDDKDSLIRLASKWIWEVGELQATTRRADKEALKGFISTEEVTVRKPYGANDMIKPAMASLIGTINEDGAGFLTDPTGNRRFVVIHMQTIDHRYTELDPAQLWAQAVALYKQGEPWSLTPQERQWQAEINSQYESDSVVALFFHESFTITDNPNDYCTADEILRTLRDEGLQGSQQANMNEVARIMKRLGVTKFRAREGTKRPMAYRNVARINNQ